MMEGNDEGEIKSAEAACSVAWNGDVYHTNVFLVPAHEGHSLLKVRQQSGAWFLQGLQPRRDFGISSFMYEHPTQ